MLTSPPESRVISPSAERTQAPYGEDLLSLPDSRSERAAKKFVCELRNTGPYAYKISENKAESISADF